MIELRWLKRWVDNGKGDIVLERVLQYRTVEKVNHVNILARSVVYSDWQDVTEVLDDKRMPLPEGPK